VSLIKYGGVSCITKKERLWDISVNDEKLKVLFLCTGNSCRSQMAEGWAEFLKSDCIDACSAGVMPGRVNEKAIEIMAEVGVDISGHYSKHIEDLAGIEFDYIVTVCDNAREQCPMFVGSGKIVHNQFDDPSFVIGTVEEVNAEFRRVRDEIRAFVETMPGSLCH
jgi:arsenate reductase